MVVTGIVYYLWMKIASKQETTPERQFKLFFIKRTDKRSNVQEK